MWDTGQWLVRECLHYSDGRALYALLAAICTWFAIKLGNLYILTQRQRPVDFTVSPPRELSADWQGREWSEIKGANKEIIQYQAVLGEFDDSKILSYCPADGRLLGGTKPATAADVERAVDRAVAAQGTWQNTSFSERRRVLRTLLKYVLEHQDDLVTACCLDSGKTKVDACFGEIMVTAEKLKWTIDHGEASLSANTRPTNLLMMYKRNTVRYEPLGVVAACVSWNYPFHNLISPVISAIFAGNSIIVKPSEHTVWSSAYFCDMIRRAIAACGHPEDLVQRLVCLPKVADVLTSHPKIDHIIFIGSRWVAREVCKSAAKALTSVTVELGGKDPAVVLQDRATMNDLESIASILMRGVFQSAGQNCVGIERVIALPNAYDKLLEIVPPRIKSLRPGSVLLESKRAKPRTPDVGALISARSFDVLERLIEEAVKDGARLICGGKRYNHPDYPHGHYFMPTMLADVDPNMRIANTELFAPIFLLMRAESVEEAIEMANSTEYALGASIFGHERRQVDKCVRSIKAGMVSVNDFGTYYAVGLPFGGVKGSGYGRFGGAEGLRSLSNLKAVCVDGYPGIQTRIPPTLDYPIQKGEKQDGRGAWEMCKGVVETGYQPSVMGKIGGIRKILTNM